MGFELNIPAASENENSGVWLDHPTKEGESVSLTISRVHIGEKTVMVFDNDNDQQISFFHVSDFEGQTMGERALIAIAQAAGLEGESNSDDVVAAANAFFAENAATLTETLRGYEHEGEQRTFRAISVKVE